MLKVMIQLELNVWRVVMNKTVVISSCSHCPYFDNFYYDYDRTCTLLGKVVCNSQETYNTIDPDCPLEFTDDEVKDKKAITEK